MSKLPGKPRVPKPTKNGNFNIRAPTIKKMPFIPGALRVHNLLHLPSREVARAFGVDKSTITDWRKKIRALERDRPSIWVDLGYSAKTISFAKMFYEKGGNELRKHLGLSKSGVDGLLVTLALYGHIKEPRVTYLKRIMLDFYGRSEYSVLSRNEFIHWFAFNYNLTPVFAKELLGGVR